MMKRPEIAARLAAAAMVAAVVAFPQAASAQHVAVIVNGAPITTYDIEQRIKFTTLASHKTASRQEIIQELIDEKLKVQIAERYKLEITDDTEPTERSMPAVIMTNVCPTPRMQLYVI